MQISTTQNNALFSDLGKYTTRGVKKCPICGTCNGTKAIICKNTSCSIALRNYCDKTKLDTVACKLVTDLFTQIYSICARNKEFEQYGFVQLSFSGVSKASDMNNTGLCFIDTCQRSFNTNILNCHENSIQKSNADSCSHIKIASQCTSVAAPFSVETSSINNLRVSTDIKQNLHSLMEGSLTPLVQRISRTVFVIRCMTSSKHPLGFLHFTIFIADSKQKAELHYSCQCSDFKMYLEEETELNRCVHYYACLCAVESDSNLRQEFAQFLNGEKIPIFPILLNESDEDLDEHEREKMIEFLETSSSQIKLQLFENCRSTVKQHDMSAPRILSELLLNLEDQSFIQHYRINTFCDDQRNINSPNQKMSKNVKRKFENTSDISCKRRVVSTQSSENRTVQKDNIVPTSAGRKISPESRFVRIFPKRPFPKSTNCPVTINFYEWLASVTERINHQMHYQFSGKSQTLVFHTQQVFFDCLLERISTEGNKKRLPNSTVAFTQKNAIPLGTFTKFTWYITNVIHVKQIFDNPVLPLKLTRSFIKNGDGTYCDFVEPKLASAAISTNNEQIKPLEVKTFLKVGRIIPDQNESTPFIIEWIPNVLPVTKIGILKIAFEYGHSPPVNRT